MPSKELATSTVIRRYAGNPVLSAEDVPYPSGLVFNAGVTKFQGRYVMVFRNDVVPPGTQRVGSTNLGLAFSDDGLSWQVAPKPCFSIETEEMRRAYDPRLTIIDGRCYMCFAVDTRHGLRGGIAVTDDFENFEILHLTLPENRNMVLFPEKLGGQYVRLDRPFPMYGRSKTPEAFDVWLSRSNDLRYWGDHELVLAWHDVEWSNRKIGPAAPPVRTPKGWLTVFHAVDFAEGRQWGWSGNWQKRYTAGVMLLDLEDPTKIVGRSHKPLIVPEPQYDYEAHGYRDYVIFPCGMILEDGGEVKIYYGAADTVVALATADVDDLIRLCLE